MRFVVCLLILASGCAGGRAAAPPPAPEPAQRAPAQRPADRARLVVAVVVDQLGSDVLERYWDLLPSDGALKRAARRGAFHHRVVFGYAGTYTAPGHATVHTGVPPREHGITANQVYDRSRDAVVPIVDDGAHPWLGQDDAYAAPAALRAPTVADRLKEATGGRAKVATLSVKDRGAVLAGGKAPDLALWYDARLGRYTTSTYYADALPPWLETWSKAHPVEAILEPWEAADPALLGRHAGADDAPGEGDWLGLGTTFPHDPRAGGKPFSAVRATPQSSEHLLELAWAATEELELGVDEVPDLLAISISSTDYVGHVFGPRSWEYLDNLIRVDRALGRFLARMAQRTPTAVLITSDHGVAPLPEQMRGQTGRIDPADWLIGLDAHLDAELGEDTWVAAFSQPFVYLSEEARAPEHRDRAVAEAVEWLKGRPDVAIAYDTRRLAGLDPSAEAPAVSAVTRAAMRSTPPDTDADIFVVPAPGYVMDEAMVRGKGTSHGTPWPYDREVPVLVYGPGVARTETREPLPMTRTAPTLAALLGLDEAGMARPLPGLGD
ncbi:MAG: alkaline phosphatase family protein [Myxococcota bacterium]